MGLILLHRIRKRDRCSERIFDADIYADSSYCARLYHLAVEEPEALQRCKQQGNDDSLKKVKLFEYHDKYMELGSIPPYAFENFCDMYESYHELGGNGTGTKMYEEIKDLHLNKKKGD